MTILGKPPAIPLPPLLLLPCCWYLIYACTALRRVVHFACVNNQREGSAFACKQTAHFGQNNDEAEGQRGGRGLPLALAETFRHNSMWAWATTTALKPHYCFN